MRVLMISLARDMLANPIGDTVERHINYAKRAKGQIHMVGYTLRKDYLKPQSFENCFFIYPSDSMGFYTFPIDAYRLAMKLCQKHQFDIIYTQDPFGTGLAGTWLRSKKKLPLIVGNHSNFIDNEYWIAERPILFSFFNRLAKYVLRRADAYRVVNEKEKSVYEKTLDIASSKIFIINTPVRLELFTKTESRKKLVSLKQSLGIGVASFVAIWVGRPAPVKRLPLLLQAFQIVQKTLPDARLVLIGNEKFDKDGLSEMIIAMGLEQNVIWLKKGVPHGELPQYYQMADLYLHTSNYEGSPKVLVEAAVSGLPIVSTDTAGGRRVVQDGETGFLVPIGDAKSLADKSLHLARNKQLAKKMGEKSLEFVLEKFDRMKNEKRIIDMWIEVKKR